MIASSVAAVPRWCEGCVGSIDGGGVHVSLSFARTATHIPI